MPFNGAGVFNRIYSWVTDAANGLNVSSTRMDTDTNDIASGLSLCLTKDGQQTPTANIPMGGYKLTGLGLGTSNTDAASVQNANILAMCEFRLTLTTGTPVTTSDVTAATTIYCTPYKGNRIALYDGSNWNMRSTSEMSIAVPATTATMYDVFCYDNSGTPALEVLAWTNDTTRATALTTLAGVLVKSGVNTRRYLGSFRTTGVSGQTEDSIANRFLWNYYNRVLRPMRALESTVTWNYTTATIRQANASASNQLNFIIGWAEDAVSAEVYSSAYNGSTSVSFAVGIGLDTTSAFTAGNIHPNSQTLVIGAPTTTSSALKCYPGVGKHYLSWNEYSQATGTTTWQGAFSPIDQNGIHGELMG